MRLYSNDSVTLKIYMNIRYSWRSCLFKNFIVVSCVCIFTQQKRGGGRERERKKKKKFRWNKNVINESEFLSHLFLMDFSNIVLCAPDTRTRKVRYLYFSSVFSLRLSPASFELEFRMVKICFCGLHIQIAFFLVYFKNQNKMRNFTRILIRCRAVSIHMNVWV